MCGIKECIAHRSLGVDGAQMGRSVCQRNECPIAHGFIHVGHRGHADMWDIGDMRTCGTSGTCGTWMNRHIESLPALAVAKVARHVATFNISMTRISEYTTIF